MKTDISNSNEEITESIDSKSNIATVNIKGKNENKSNLTNIISSNNKLKPYLMVAGVSLVGLGVTMIGIEANDAYAKISGYTEQLNNIMPILNDAKETISKIDFQSIEQYKQELMGLGMDLEKLSEYKTRVPELEDLISHKQNTAKSSFIISGAISLFGAVTTYFGYNYKSQKACNSNSYILGIEHIGTIDNHTSNLNSTLYNSKLRKSELLTPDVIELGYENVESKGNLNDQNFGNTYDLDSIGSSLVLVYLYEDHMAEIGKKLNPNISLRLQRLHEDIFKDGVSDKSAAQVANDFGCPKSTLYKSVKLLNELTGKNYSFGKK